MPYMKKLEANNIEAGSSFIILHRPPFLNSVLTSPFRPSQVSTLSDPFPTLVFESSQHWKSYAGWEEKTKQTAKETMQAKMIAKSL